MILSYVHTLRLHGGIIASAVTLHNHVEHYIDGIMTTMAPQIASLTVVYSIVYSRRRSKKTSKLRITGLCAGNSPGPVNSLHKGPVTRKMFPFDDVIMGWCHQNPHPHYASNSGQQKVIWTNESFSLCQLYLFSISSTCKIPHVHCPLIVGTLRNSQNNSWWQMAKEIPAATTVCIIAGVL